MKRRSTVLAAAAAVCALTFSGQTNRPEFKPAPEVPAMPKALMKFPRTQITRAKYPAIDFHLHGGGLKTDTDYKMIGQMDQARIAMICNMDGGYGSVFDGISKWEYVPRSGDSFCQTEL